MEKNNNTTKRLVNRMGLISIYLIGLTVVLLQLRSAF